MQNGNKIKQVATKYTKWTRKKSKFSIQRPFKMYQNWFENKPSGNPGLEQETAG
jgi:hypothetical protein